MDKSKNYITRQKMKKAFSLIELLIVISIMALLMSIFLPFLIGAKEQATELNAIPAGIDEESNVYLEIHKLVYRKYYEDIYMILIKPPKECPDCKVSLKRPYPKGMKVVERNGNLWDGQYLKWRPEVEQIGEHKVTIAFKGEKPSEQEITIFVYNEELLEKQLEEEEKKK
jgi:prepilin-type N-terminal cleavage/methylation domain-containing protein